MPGSSRANSAGDGLTSLKKGKILQGGYWNDETPNIYGTWNGDRRKFDFINKRF